MKNKFNAGDKVIYINSFRTDGVFEVSAKTIETVFLSKNPISYEDIIEYEFKDFEFKTRERHLYTKEEAVEFLKGVL